MKTLTAKQAQIQIAEIIKAFYDLAKIHQDRFIKFTGEIENVGFLEILKLWTLLKSDKIRLYMPGELDNDRITIMYRPDNGCVISIESEKCNTLNKQDLMKRKINMN